MIVIGSLPKSFYQFRVYLGFTLNLLSSRRTTQIAGSWVVRTDDTCSYKPIPTLLD